LQDKGFIKNYMLKFKPLILAFRLKIMEIVT
jgi:hypothetical protein